MMSDPTSTSMFAKIAQYVGGKVLTAVLIVAVGLTGYWFYKHPEQIGHLWQLIKGALLWLGIVLLLPWASFFAVGWVVKRESNLIAAAMLIGYLVIDVVSALWIAGWSVSGTLSWAVLVLGFMVAGIYNFVVCDFLAERAEES